MAAVGVVLMIALSAVTLQRAATPEPAVTPSSAPTLPDRVYDHPAWGPVGMPREPVVAAQLATRETWGGPVNAISVITGSGRYLYLDVDGDLAERIALSPDGRRVAYWLAGTPRGTPRTREGHNTSVTTVAVVDVVTGAVVRHEFATEHGITSTALLWADATTLVGAFAQWKAGADGTAIDQSSAVGGTSWAWDVSRGGELRQLEGEVFSELDAFSEAAGERLLIGRDVVDLATGDVRRVARRGFTGSSGAAGSNAVLRQDGTLAQIGGPGLGGRVPNQVTLGDLDDAVLGQQVVPGTERTFQVLGWRDAQHLVVVRRTTSGPESVGSDELDYEIVSIDVATGDAEPVTTGGSSMLAWDWAEGLLTAPVVDAVQPSDPVDPRVVAGLGVALLVGTVGGLALWRRRARP
ncbi:hypothetical protein EUA93_17035 [Nocardioides oleivorans]|uniref:WD40 repeat domain-containing protein n=1 Tax=Nocardioides oleivorans TaxID=273676 RepID=A0A4Q2RTA2_9ACTN|nr:hypothetical protein [Nocardioides oleivorans]RYB91836.1 hypothetical protein EUA93_17035 [Nocardioides oleivorans]